ncbi:MAG TPA: site-2 protease family protein [Vicinamibacterales bacterium]|nr:site-2 protease family protein [Vicinamibacterales bacterium]
MADIDLSQIAVAFVILIASLSFHEAAHAWTANKLGDPTARMLGRLSLNPAVHVDVIGTLVFPLVAMLSGFPLIGWAKPVPVDMRNLQHPRRDFAIVAAAGPISNLILAAVGAVVFMLWDADAATPANELLATGLIRFVLLNVLLAVFNMLPIPPLDGGNVLMGILPEPMAVLVDKLRPWGFVLLYVLMLSGMLAAIIFPVQRAVLNWLL